MDVRKKDGGVYEPGTLASLQRSSQRCLKDNNSNTNILKDQEFAKSREFLTARKRDLVVNNTKGNRPQAVRELTKGEEDRRKGPCYWKAGPGVESRTRFENEARRRPLQSF